MDRGRHRIVHKVRDNRLPARRSISRRLPCGLWSGRHIAGLFVFRRVGLPYDAAAPGHLPTAESGSDEIDSTTSAAAEIIAFVPCGARQW